jgi:hypothetical protein
VTADEFDGFAVVDRYRSVCLCNVGAPGFSVPVAVTSDGRDTLWIVDEAELQAKGSRRGNGDRPHEQLGPLPEHWRERVAWSALIRCGRSTKKKRPCRIPVAQAGDACEFHRAARPDAERQTAP